MARARRGAQEAPEQAPPDTGPPDTGRTGTGRTDTGRTDAVRRDAARAPRGRAERGRADTNPDGAPAAPASGATLETRNEVVLVGRVAAAAEERTLPSGDVILTWRLVVDRPASRRPVPEGVRVPTVDTLDCVAWAAGVRRTARTLAAGDVVAVDGALRRRFWRAGTGAVSRCEIEVAKVKRLARAAQPGRGSDGGSASTGSVPTGTASTGSVSTGSVSTGSVSTGSASTGTASSGAGSTGVRG